MKKIAIKHTLEIPSKDWDVLVRYFKKTHQIRTSNDLRNMIKGVAERFGNEGVYQCIDDALDWLEENEPQISKTLIDNCIKDYKNHINPSEKVKKNMDKFIEYWEEVV